MSIERLFYSKTSGSIYRLGESIRAGELGHTLLLEDATEKLLIYHCDEEDEGGAVIGVDETGFRRLDEERLEVAPGAIEMLEQTERTTGTLFEGPVTLGDGDEGTLFVRHADSAEVKYN